MKKIDLIANASSEANELIKQLIKNNYCVNHIYTGSDTPVLKDNDNFIIGANNIRLHYIKN